MYRNICLTLLVILNAINLYHTTNQFGNDVDSNLSVTSTIE